MEFTYLQDSGRSYKMRITRFCSIYAPDANANSNSESRYNSSTRYHTSDRSINQRRETADEYRKILDPKKTDKRMEFNPYIPKTLTPKGYAKLKLMMSVASKQYETLVRRLQRSNTLWEDPDFPASDSSIGIDNMRGQMEWKRPKEINPNAQYFVGGVSRFDIEQGAVGDCWLMAVMSSISSYPPLYDHVLPKEQSMDSSGYVGVFRCRFWRFGQWVEVLVDDRLPVHRGSTRLAFMHSSDDSEFWSALLEKAYAKLNGCYNHLSGGSQSEAMEDLTGGVCESIEMERSKRPHDLLEQMIKYAERCCLMGCSVDSNVVEARLDNGLIGGHAYSVTGIHAVTYRGQQQYLVRCRNPWGGNYEWKGAWADRAPEWNDVDEQDKKAIDLKFRADGEFWMSYEDFVTNFTRLEVCHLGLESLEHDQDFRGKRRLEESIFSGHWEVNVNAGGCVNNRASFWTNPQFQVTVTDPDPDDEEQKCMIIIGLMQRDVRRKLGADFNTIGFMVYKIPQGQTSLFTKSQLLRTAAVGKSTFSNSREVTANLSLSPGSYMIIPSTFQPNVDAQFILRVFSQVAVKDGELDDDNSNQDVSVDVIEALKLEDQILNEDQEIEMRFNEVMDPDTRAIDAIKLRELLNNSSLQDVPNFQGFNKEMCRSMVASVDQNLTGMVELSEFMDLWQKAKAWKNIFLKHDVDGQGLFTPPEFREALTTSGYNVSNRLFNALVHRYQDPKADGMHFEDFLMCAIRLKNVFETVASQPKNADGAPIFHAEDYLRLSVYV